LTDPMDIVIMMYKYKHNAIMEVIIC